jgi:hypothetical protein
MTMHEVVGRVELAGRTIINLEEDRVRSAALDHMAVPHIFTERENFPSALAVHRLTFRIAPRRPSLFSPCRTA